ncbi:IS982 family transposase [Deinococcus aquatilis]|uniref:IS982 family transposase n=1 Tax=Deinococcus aquatilis TaxID=519440 RepID=UPI000375FDBF
MNILELFCDVDDFCQALPPFQVSLTKPALPEQALHSHLIRNRPTGLHLSEIMTILIAFHQSSYRQFKAYYTTEILTHGRADFPKALTSSRFVELMPRALLHLVISLYRSFGACTGISFVDSTKLEVCRLKRMNTHRVFKENAALGKTSMGWFYGFKLHLMCGDTGELLWVGLTPGNGDDRAALRDFFQHGLFSLFGKVFADRRYISQALVTELLKEHQVALHTRLRKNMKCAVPVLSEDALFLRKRAIIESVIDQLKNISQVEHSRHRSPVNFMVNLVCGLIAYSRQPKKPSLIPEAGPLKLAA